MPGDRLPLSSVTTKSSRAHHALADGGRSGQDSRRIETHGNVSVGRGHEFARVDPAADGADIAPVLVFRFQNSWSNRVVEHVPSMQRQTVAPRVRVPARCMFLPTHKSHAASARRLRGQSPACTRRCGVDAMCFGIANHIVEAALQDVLEAFVDYILSPEKSLAVLDPLKIADRSRHRRSQGYPE